MQREDRVTTQATINLIVPLILFALIANFIPYFMYITPIDETSICMLFFLTKSPF